MKGFNDSGSMAALLSMCPLTEVKQRKEKQGYSEEFQVMLDRLDQEDYDEDSTSSVFQKKRRLSFDQVKALERNFELDNKLEPERKVKLAEELGLQPRQVAIWYQNRRARWKTRQLERDYGILKSNFDALKLDYNNLEQENKALTIKLSELKAKLHRSKAENNECVREESSLSGFRDRAASESNSDGAVNAREESNVGSSLFFNESFPNSISLKNRFESSDSRGSTDRAFQSHFVGLDEQSLFSVNEFCSLFPVDQSPIL